MAGIVGLALVTLVKGTVLDHSTSVTLVGRLGVVATTVFAVATLFCIYRTFVSASWVAAVLATVLYGPAAVWAWLVFVEGSVPSTHFTTAGFIVSAAISVVLLSRGLSEARWAEVFGGLAAADLVFSVMPFRGDEPQESLVFVALLVALAGATGLYGLLVDVELSAYESLDEIQQSNEVLVRENKRNNELLHDLRSGLLSIEAAALSSGSGLSAPVSSEAARLRRLTAVYRDGPPSFDLVPGVRDLVASKEAAGAVLALSVPSRVEVTGDESEVLAIVENLIANAQRHGRSPVEIQVECANGTVELSVADSGGGIDESVRDRVFERGVTTDPEG
ncbi:MAG: HAMP domain-containing histidine kinase, partial [Actinomycetia bacterium]|nr:HAMP domain-containing histidine kinase [Actinomycetes bacterium]